MNKVVSVTVLTWFEKVCENETVALIIGFVYEILFA